MEEFKFYLRLTMILSVLLTDYCWVHYSIYNVYHREWEGLENHAKICLTIHGILAIILFVLFMNWLWF